jgi:hypothetical protein
MISKGHKLVAGAIIFATLMGAWLFRFETVGQQSHRNRFTGVLCHITTECWFSGY